MTLENSLKEFLSLCDEYAPDSGISNLFTTDEDIRTKVLFLYDLAYQKVANIKTLTKSRELSFSYTGEDTYEEVKLPNARQIKRIFCLDSDNKPTSGDFFYKDDQKVMISNNLDVTYICEYIPRVGHIDSTTDLGFTFETPDDINVAIPYMVASDLFKTDPSVNWQYFETMAQSTLNNIVISNRGMGVTIMEGEF